MNALTRNALALVGLTMATQAAAQVTFYEREGFEGRSFTTQRQVSDLERYGLSDRASSVVVTGAQVEVCEYPQFGGRCVVLRQGQYPSLAAMGLNNRISSVRTLRRNERFGDDRYAPEPVVSYDYRRRRNERLYPATVTSVHAVVGPPEQRCWVEREQVVRERRNVGGALFGAVIGGILGHQIGDGRGQDLATVGGAVAGAAVGANVGRGGHGRQVISRNVQRCAVVPSQAEPDYWDVTYVFRGRQFRVQMTDPPGATVTVNRRGEPRT